MGFSTGRPPATNDEHSVEEDVLLDDRIYSTMIYSTM